ncbi:MAG: peptide-methionine (S)-S-oxide reductase [Bacteroidetes bacterium]|nr:peptide-methionine (S)-S-oxide reductase [Bacteroidota bacterium]
MRTKKNIINKVLYDSPIVTQLEPFTIFYKAEDYHQDYFNNNKSQGYCQMVIQPKIDKFEKIFKDRLKKINLQIKAKGTACAETLKRQFGFRLFFKKQR